MINQKVQITIAASAKKVFNYVADLRNDMVWRKEVNWVLLDENFNIGSVAVECSYLSKRVPEHIQKLKCIDLDPVGKVTYQTLSNGKHYLRTTRSVIATEDNKTVFTYQLIFNPSTAKYGLGFSMPIFIVSWVTKIKMKKYVKHLKQILENEI